MPQGRRNRTNGNRRGPAMPDGLTPEEATAAIQSMDRVRETFAAASRRIGVNVNASLESLVDGFRNMGAAFRGTFVDAEGNLVRSWREIARLIEENEPPEGDARDDSETVTYLREAARQFRIARRDEHDAISVSDEMASHLARRLEEIAEQLAIDTPPANRSEPDPSALVEITAPPEHVNALAYASSREEIETLARQVGIDPPPPSDAGPIVSFSDIGRAIDRHLNGNPAATPREVFIAAETLEETGGASVIAFDNPIDWAVFVVSYALDDGRRFPAIVTFEGVRAVYRFDETSNAGHALIVEVALGGPAGDVRRPQFRLEAAHPDNRQFRGRSWRVTLLGEQYRIDVDDFEHASIGRTWGALAQTVINGARQAQDTQVLTGPRRDWARHLRGPMIEMIGIWRPDFIAFLGIVVRRIQDRPTQFSISVQLAPALIADGSGPRNQNARRFVFVMTAPTRARPEWGIVYGQHPATSLFQVDAADRARSVRAGEGRAEARPENDENPPMNSPPPEDIAVERPRLVPLEVTAEVRTESAPRRRRRPRGRLHGLARSEQRFGNAVREAIAENVDREGAGGTLEPDEPADAGEAAIAADAFDNDARIEHAAAHATGGTDPVDRVAEDAEVRRRADMLDGPVTMTRPGVTIRELDSTLYDPVAPDDLADFVAPAGTNRGAFGERFAAHAPGIIDPTVNLSGPTDSTPPDVTIREVDSTLLPPLIRIENSAPLLPADRRRAILEWARSVNFENIQAADGPDDPRVYVEAVRDVGSAGIFFAPSGVRRRLTNSDRPVTEISGQIAGGLIARPASIEFLYDADLNRFEIQLSIRSLRWRDGNLDIEFRALQSRGVVSIEPAEQLSPLALREAVHVMMDEAADGLYRQESGGHDPVVAEIAARRFFGEQMSGDTATPVRALDRYDLIPLECDIASRTLGSPVASGRIDTPMGSAGFRSGSRIEEDPDGDEHLIVDFSIASSGLRWTENVYRRDASDPRGMRTLLLRAAYNLGRRLDGMLVDGRRTLRRSNG